MSEEAAFLLQCIFCLRGLLHFHLLYVAVMPGASAILHFEPVYIPLALHDWFGAAPETRNIAPALIF